MKLEDQTKLYWHYAQEVNRGVTTDGCVKNIDHFSKHAMTPRLRRNLYQLVTKAGLPDDQQRNSEQSE